MPKRVLLTLVTVIATIVSTLVSQPLLYLQVFGHQEETCHTFAETGKSVCNRFLEYWAEHGGLSQYGFPISDLLSEISDVDGRMYTVQYFERSVFELHSEND